MYTYKASYLRDPQWKIDGYNKYTHFKISH